MLKVIGSLLLISLNLFAFVEAKLNSEKITLGESVTLTLSASGQDVVFPELINIEGFEIESTARSQNISIINGKQSINISKSFTFTPTKTISIAPMSIEVDGKEEVTKELKLEVSKQNKETKASGEEDFIFEVDFDKKEAYVGEPIKLNVFFKRHRRTEVLDIEYSQVNFPNFWSKKIGKEEAYREGNYIVHKLKFILFPQKAGKLHIEPLKLRVATPKRSRDIFGFWVKSPHWRSMFSNDLYFNIKDTPESVKMVGEFNIEASIDKDNIKANEPVNLTLKVTGEGNLDSLEDYTLNLNGAIVYADKAEKDFKFASDKYMGTYSKKFAIISSENFTIPSFKLKYFDLKTKEIKEVQTKEFNINVTTTAKSKNEVKLETKEEVKDSKKEEIKEVVKISNMDKILYFMGGLFFGIVLMLITKLIKFDFKVKEVKFSLNDRDLMKLLIPFVSKSKEAKEIVFKLEENIYHGKKHKISKKEVTKLLNEIE